MSVQYVYALVEPRRRQEVRRRAPTRIRVQNRTIRLVQVGFVLAAVEELDAAPELTEATLRAQHRVVLRLARRFDAVLPARFGAAVEATALEAVVKRHESAIRSAFDTVRGREQMTVRLFGARSAAADDSGTGGGSGRTYLQARRLARQVRLSASARRIRRAVRPLVRQELVEPGRGLIEATLHHLIERSRVAEYRSLVGEALHEGRSGGEVVVSGPWPPFAFTPGLWP
jgi:hypothetical protein